MQSVLEINAELADFVWTQGYFYSVAGWELGRPEYQDSAVKYLGKAFNNCIEVNGEAYVEWTITYAMALARNDQKKQAIRVATYGLKTAFETNDLLYKARFNKQLSQYYMALDNEDSAYYHIYESAKYDDELYAKDDPNTIRLANGEGRLHVFNLGFLISIHNQFGHTDQSSKLLNRILEGPERLIDYSSLMYYRNVGASTYYLNGEFQKSAYNYQLYTKYADSLHRANINKSREVKTAQLESQITIEKERANEVHKQQQLQAENEKASLRTIIYSTILVAAVTVIFLFVVYRRFKVTSRQKKLIEDQKKMVESAFSQLHTKNKEILSSINYAQRIQAALLPSRKDVKKYMPNAFILYMPKDIVAGDFYWLEQVSNKTIFAAADCTGHGVPGAMVSVVCNNGLNRSVREQGITDPGKILDATRKIVIDEFEKSEEEVNDGMDIALCSLEPNLENGNTKLQYAGAHNPLWVIREGMYEVEEYKADRQPVGKYRSTENYTTHSLEVSSGDQLYIFSDGYSDQFGGDRGKKYFITNFQKFLLQIKDLPLEDQKQALIDEHERWKGSHEQIDDICVIGFRIS